MAPHCFCQVANYQAPVENRIHGGRAKKFLTIMKRVFGCKAGEELSLKATHVVDDLLTFSGVRHGAN